MIPEQMIKEQMTYILEDTEFSKLGMKCKATFLYFGGTA
jgi:hypothetical protein